MTPKFDRGLVRFDYNSPTFDPILALFDLISVVFDLVLVLFLIHVFPFKMSEKRLIDLSTGGNLQKPLFVRGLKKQQIAPRTKASLKATSLTFF